MFHSHNSWELNTHQKRLSFLLSYQPTQHSIWSTSQLDPCHLLNQWIIFHYLLFPGTYYEWNNFVSRRTGKYKYKIILCNPRYGFERVLHRIMYNQMDISFSGYLNTCILHTLQSWECRVKLNSTFLYGPAYLHKKSNEYGAFNKIWRQ